MYADDSYIGGGSRILSLLLHEEFDHITDRAGKKRLNPSTTRELIVFRPRRRGHRGSQPPIDLFHFVVPKESILFGFWDWSLPVTRAGLTFCRPGAKI